MKTATILILAATLAGCGVMATDVPPQAGMAGGMHGGMQGSMPGRSMGMANHMRAMDTNQDGMLSRQEFLKAQEAMYDKMKKNEQGQVAIAAMGSTGSMGSMGMCPMMQ